jgi:hypothetical protein
MVSRLPGARGSTRQRHRRRCSGLLAQALVACSASVIPPTPPSADTSHGQRRTQRHVLETVSREGGDAARDRTNHVVAVEAKLDAAPARYGATQKGRVSQSDMRCNTQSGWQCQSCLGYTHRLLSSDRPSGNVPVSLLEDRSRWLLVHAAVNPATAGDASTHTGTREGRG